MMEVEAENSGHVARDIEHLTSVGKSYLLEDREQAIKVFRQAYEESKKLFGSSYTTRACAYNLGAACLASGSYQEALEHLREATPSGDQRDPPSNGDLFFHLGIVYEKTNSPDKAKESYDVAVEEFHYENNSEKSGQTYFRLGKVYQRFRTYSRAVSAFEQACERLSQLDLRAEALYNLARCLRHNSKGVDRRQDALIECLRICQTLEQSGDRVGARASLLGERCLLELGHTFTEVKSHTRALESYWSAVGVSKQMSDATLGWEASEGMARAHLLSGEAQQAVAGFKQALSLLVASKERSDSHIQNRLIEQLEKALQARLQAGSPTATKNQDHPDLEEDGYHNNSEGNHHYQQKLSSSSRKVKPIVSPLLDTLKNQYHLTLNSSFHLYTNGHSGKMGAADDSRERTESRHSSHNSKNGEHSPNPTPILASTPLGQPQSISEPEEGTSTPLHTQLDGNPVRAQPPPKMYPSDDSLSSTSTGSITSSSGSGSGSGSDSSSMEYVSPLSSNASSSSSSNSGGKGSKKESRKGSKKSPKKHKKKQLGMRHHGEDNFKTVAQGLQGYDTDSDLSLVLRRSKDPSPNTSVANLVDKKASDAIATVSSGDDHRNMTELHPVYEDPALIKATVAEHSEEGGEVIYSSIAKPKLPLLRLHTPGGTDRTPEHTIHRVSSSSGTSDSSSSSTSSSSEDESQRDSNDEKENTYEEINHGTMKSLANTMPTGRAPSPPGYQPPPLPTRQSTLSNLPRGERELTLYKIGNIKKKVDGNESEHRTEENTSKNSSKTCLIM